MLLGFAGVWGIVDGILAISSSKIYVANAVYVFSDLNTWGWIVLGLGALCLVAAFSLLTGGELARCSGITVAGVNAIGQLCSCRRTPGGRWRSSPFEIPIIYGLAAYAGAKLRLQ